MKEKCNLCGDKIQAWLDLEPRDALENFHQMKQEAFMDESCDDDEVCVPLKTLKNRL